MQPFLFLENRVVPNRFFDFCSENSRHFLQSINHRLQKMPSEKNAGNILISVGALTVFIYWNISAAEKTP